MKRIDSGFHESFLSKAPHNESQLMVRSNIAPTRCHNTAKSCSDNTPSIAPARMDSHPGSELMSMPFHQRSKTSSSETSTTRSRGRGHGSKLSSRRTSCTIIDPSRSRHYRMQSSHTVPTAKSQDIDDVYALHHRSYSLFQNPSLHTKSRLPSPAISHAEHFGPGSSPRFSVEERTTSSHYDQPKQSEETTTAAEISSTTMHWTSPCTRQREYERIDRANSGIRGLMNKVMPRCVSGPPEKFYEKDQSDAGSVRRYRMDEEEDATDEKELARSRTHDLKKSSAPNTNAKKWSCF
ncbi:hypothetical protein BDU57DRAFT_218858 [Ampelomyces quisqualis]|uniref:Uncharacterized protein n=1 Tax=Ampelomyces quisqualis TaxID=50730 RepID=A0A6A5QQ50_AMPQU|nr:hypothetical protein BDU57DRAFT_218858 [Ampelomyces quisqualis]